VPAEPRDAVPVATDGEGPESALATRAR